MRHNFGHAGLFPPRAGIAAALLGLLTACGGDAGRQAGAGSEGRPLSDSLLAGGTAVVAVAASPTTALPPFAATALDSELGSLLFLPLNGAVWSNGRVVYEAGGPLALAREWSIDGARLTYHLAPRSWSDGRPVTARDVVFTYALLADEQQALPMGFAAARLDSVRAPDDSTVVFHFERAYPGMLFDTGIGILPEHVYRPRDTSGGEEAAPPEPGEAPPVVSGPFAVSEWRPSDRIVLERNPSAPVGARLDRVVVRVLPEETARLAALRTGEVDMAQVTSYEDAAHLREGGELRLLRQPQRGLDYVAWNPAGHVAFADVAVRRALSLAINRDALIRALGMEGFAEKAYGPYGSLFGGLRPEPPAGKFYDPEKARQLLEDAGWSDADGDGIRERDGTPLAFELLTTSGNQRRSVAVQAIREQLAVVGARATLGMQDLTSLFDRAMRRDYEAVLLGWQVSLDPDISMYWRDPESPLNVVGYDSPAVRAQIDSARQAATFDGAADHWKRAARLIAADYPYAFLWFFDLVVAVSPRLQGVEVDPIGFLRNVHEWGVTARR